MRCVCRVFLLGLFLAIPVQSTQARENIPTPRSAVKFDYGADARNLDWQLVTSQAESGRYLVELTPGGRNPVHWTELVVIQILLGDYQLTEYVQTYEKGMRGADPKMRYGMKQLRDGSFLVEYSSLRAGETGIRRFFRGSDGLYMVAYTIRPPLATPAILAAWKKNLLAAELVRNPEARR